MCSIPGKTPDMSRNLNPAFQFVANQVTALLQATAPSRLEETDNRHAVSGEDSSLCIMTNRCIPQYRNGSAVKRDGTSSVDGAHPERP